MNDGRLIKRLTDAQRSSVVSHIDVTRDARYVIAVESCHGHVMTSDHFIVYDVNSEQVLCDDTSQSNVVQLATTADSDKVYTSMRTVVFQHVNMTRSHER